MRTASHELQAVWTVLEPSSEHIAVHAAVCSSCTQVWLLCVVPEGLPAPVQVHTRSQYLSFIRAVALLSCNTHHLRLNAVNMEQRAAVTLSSRLWTIRARSDSDAHIERITRHVKGLSQLKPLWLFRHSGAHSCNSGVAAPFCTSSGQHHMQEGQIPKFIILPVSYLCSQTSEV